MIKFYLSILILVVSTFANCSPEIKLRAAREGWVYTDEHPDYAKGLIRPLQGQRKEFTYESLKDVDLVIPDDYDLRPKISPIRDQGPCGSCWAFSIIAMVVDALMVQGKPYLALSEQYLVDCAKDMYGCNGGMPEAAKWVTVPYGAPSSASYPYTARNGRCQNKPIAGKALEWHYIGQEGRSPTVDEIKKAIFMYGPSSVTVAADNAFAGYRSGVFHGNSNDINHMTNIVGWNKAGGYWIMRNSWNTRWGMEGWMYIAYGANSIAEDAIFVKVEEVPPMPVTREFGMESKNLSIKVTLKPENKADLANAKSIMQTYLNVLDRR